MKYDFITVLDRTGADSIAANIDPWGVSPAPAQRIPMWVADMSFPTAPPILEAMHKRLAFPNFGYFSMPDEYFDCILRWQETRNSLTGLTRADIGYENGVLGGVSSAVQALTVPGEGVLLHAPAYIGFTHVLDNLGRKAELSPLRRDENGVWRMHLYRYIVPPGWNCHFTKVELRSHLGEMPIPPRWDFYIYCMET